MNPELRAFIGRSSYYRGSVLELAAMLPADDEALDALIGETLDGSDQTAFVFVTMAALAVGRKVDARHLAFGAMLLPDRWTFGVMAFQMKGDVAKALLTALEETNLTGEILATAIYLAAHFQEDGPRGRLPGPLLAAARTAARCKDAGDYEQAMLFALATMHGDGGLLAIVYERARVKPGDARIRSSEKAAQAVVERMIQLWSEPVLELLPETPSRMLAQGNTMRRSVARVGRNERCPCGSGKKYKQCCMAADGERLRHSTSIAGVTDTELRENPERYLTVIDLNAGEPHEVARYDPAKIEPGLREAYLACLCRGKLYERCVQAMERFGFSAELEEAWDNISIRVAQARRKDLVDRMKALRPDAPTARLGAVELFLREEDPVKMAQFLTESVMHLLQDDPDPRQLLSFAATVMNSRLCALGILIARGVIPLLPHKDAVELMEHLLRSRDLLNLPPEDPISEVLDRRFLESRGDGSRETAVLRAVQQRFLDKQQEVLRFQENVTRLEKELARRTEELRAAPEPAKAEASPTVETLLDEPAMEELRKKVAALRSALKERHSERNELRRELHKAHSELETLRQQAPGDASGAAGDEEVDREEDLLLPQDEESNHPVRLIEFPKDFRETLASLPKSVARGTISTLGRIAAGESAAFIGAVRLKACPTISRIRIGIDFRLLFRLTPERVQVVDLIPRQDLERRIKTLI